jgi:PKD repeat protein
VVGEHTYQLVGWADGASSPSRTTTVAVDQTFVARFNGLPRARVTATPTTGKAPLVVQLSAAGSVDPEGAALTYAWDLDGDTQLDDATGATVSQTYTTKGTRQVTVRVTDSFGATSTALVSITVKPGKR